MSTILGSDGQPIASAQGATPPADVAPTGRGLGAVRGNHIVSLATAQSAMATAAKVARNNAEFAHAMEAEAVAVDLRQLALALRDALVDHVRTLKIANRWDFEVIPPQLVQGLQDYAEQGTPTGDFLRAVLENDLQRAVAYGDAASLDVLPQIVRFVQHCEDIPDASHGSPAKVAEWIATKARERADALAARELVRGDGGTDIPTETRPALTLSRGGAGASLPDPSDAAPEVGR